MIAEYSDHCFSPVLMLRFFGHFFVKSEAKLDVLRRFKFSAVAMDSPPSTPIARLIF
jgi:hypothetical protein